MSVIKTILDTKEGEFEVYFDENKWRYRHNNQEVEESYLKALMTRGIGVETPSTEIPYNASLLSEITRTPKHFWYNCDQRTKELIQKILNDVFEDAQPRLLEIREKYLRETNSNRMKAIHKARAENKASKLNG
jgi:hypothetical protein